MRTWTATTTVDAAPEAVLDVLTDPDAIARWAPLPFDVEDLDTPRLMPGSTARVSGRLAGRRVGFVVEVHEAASERLVARRRRPGRPRRRLRRSPPPSAAREVHASVSVRYGRGITGRLLAEATNALLSAGALTHAVSRLAAQAACPA